MSAHLAKQSLVWCQLSRLKHIPFSGLSIRRMQERFLLKVVGWEGAAAVLRFTHTFSQVVQSNMNLSTGVRELSGCNQSP